MTAAPLIAYSMTEIPATGDSMEMASPYQGQADDFDIDIDLMEDNVSNMDSDMMGADEFTITSQPNQLNNDAIHDADMADEPSEGSMIDADNYVDEDNDIDVQFEEELYEEEMIEADQTEDINITTPAIPFEPVGSNEDAASPIKEDATITPVEPLEAAPQASSGPVEVAPVEDAAQASVVEGPNTQAQPNTATHDLAEEPSESVVSPESGDRHGNADVGEEANKISQHTVSETEVSQSRNEELETSQTKPSVENSHVDTAARPEVQPVSEGDHQVAEENESVQQVAYVDEPLHIVKILYQNSEISLFPPLEGDLADTFFIEDEGLAYDNIGQIFKALRQVLQETMTGNEVLVIDIDTLGIQMTEDSFHTSQVTLHQILDLYLRLCRNEGTTEPDALYLTLSTKRAFPAEIADLNDAAIDGKTLSELHAEIHSWDEYDEAEPGSGDDLDAHGAEEHEDEIYYTTEAQKELSATEVQTAPEPVEEQALDSEQSQVQPEVVSDTQPEIVQTQDDNRSISSGRSAKVAPESESHPAQLETKEQDQFDASHHLETDQDQEYDHDHGDTNEEHYDSEGRQSDSTATVAAVPGPSEVKEHTPHAPLDVSADAGTDHNDEDDYYGDDHEDDGLGPEEYYEHEDIGSVDDSEAFQQDITGNENADVDAQEPADQASVLEDEDDADGLDAPPTDEVVSEILLQNDTNRPSHNQPAPSLGSGLHDSSDKKEKTPEPADDSIGNTGGLVQTPPRDTENNTLDHFEGIDYDEPEDELDAHISANDGANDNFDENHFGDYDAHFEESEAVELVGTDPSLTDPQTDQNSTKRSREDEDDWDLVETTADPKRRRSS